MKRNDSHTPAHRVRRKFPLDDSLFSDSRIEPEDVVRRHCSHGVVSGQGEIHLGGDKGPPPSQDLTDRLGSAPRATRHHTNTAVARSNGCYPNILHKIHPGAGVILFLSLLLTCPDLSTCQQPVRAGGPPGRSGSGSGLDLWRSERPQDMANIQDLDVMCGKSHMEVTLTFDRPFNGIVFSKGAVDQYNCIYVTPQTGQTVYKFDIMYDQCGSKPDLNGRFYENNIVVQYDKDLIEVWDEAKRLRCEWYNDYEKGVTKPPIRVSDIEVVELNFRGDNVDCWMEIQQGKGPWASPVNGIVPLGTTLTMVVGIDDKEGEFDMRVKSCEASDAGSVRPIQLSDENGCVLRPKMFSKFMKMRSTDSRATVVTYAFFHAFKFPDSMAVHIRCKVEICRFGCPDHCQSPAEYVAREQLEVSTSLNQKRQISPNPNLRNPFLSSPPQQPKQQQLPVYNNRQAYQQQPQRRQDQRPVGVSGSTAQRQSLPPPPPPPRQLPRPLPLNGAAIPPPPPVPSALQRRHQMVETSDGDMDLPSAENEGRKASGGGGGIFGDLVGSLPKLPSLPAFPNFFGGGTESVKQPVKRKPENKGETVKIALGPSPKIEAGRRPSTVPIHRSSGVGEKQPMVYPSSFNTPEIAAVQPLEDITYNRNAVSPGSAGGPFHYGPRSLKLEELPTTLVEQAELERSRSVYRRRRRSEPDTDQGTELGVQSAYEVVSEVDLDFTPDLDEERQRIAVFQGKIHDEEDGGLYGVCLPATGFSALFVLFSLLTVVSILVSGFVCYHRTLAKVSEENPPEPNGAAVANAAAAAAVAAQAAAVQQQMGWGFGTWFKQHENSSRMRPALF